MPDLTLTRVARTSKATFGVLKFTHGDPFAVTLERPWLDNKVKQSCIPEGKYECKRVNSPKFGDTFEITGVKGRSAILFHAGNVPEHSLGCVLVGERFDPINGQNGLSASKEGFVEFLSHQKGVDTFTLTVL